MYPVCYPKSLKKQDIEKFVNVLSNNLFVSSIDSRGIEVIDKTLLVEIPILKTNIQKENSLLFNRVFVRYNGKRGMVYELVLSEEDKDIDLGADYHIMHSDIDSDDVLTVRNLEGSLRHYFKEDYAEMSNVLTCMRSESDWTSSSMRLYIYLNDLFLNNLLSGENPKATLNFYSEVPSREDVILTLRCMVLGKK